MTLEQAKEQYETALTAYLEVARMPENQIGGVQTPMSKLLLTLNQEFLENASSQLTSIQSPNLANW